MSLQYYKGREQTYVKHFVLRKYLQRLAFKLGGFTDNVTLNYVDGFSGPWNEQASDLSDTSPHIALSELTAARDALKRQGRQMSIRCLFVDKDTEAHAKLEQLRPAFPTVDIQTIHGRFEASIPAALQFAHTGQDPFLFLFIDPRGWKGYGLKTITPLLQVHRGEVLVNFMTDSIRRFVDSGDNNLKQTFVDLFGTEDYRDEWRTLSDFEREDAIVQTYCDRLRGAGSFEHVASSIVLFPLQDRSHFHLVYGTRSLRGLVTFKEVERGALKEQADIRSQAQQDRRIEDTGQLELLTASETGSTHPQELAIRYRRAAKRATTAELQEKKRVSYDGLVALALRRPMTSEADLKAWLKDLKRSRQACYQGLKRGERVPKLGQGHHVVWTG